MEIRSWPGQGTKVEVWVPLNPVMAATVASVRQLDFYGALTRQVNEPVPIFPGSSGSSTSCRCHPPLVGFPRWQVE